MKFFKFLSWIRPRKHKGVDLSPELLEELDKTQEEEFREVRERERLDPSYKRQ